VNNHGTEPADLHPTDQLAPLLAGDLTLTELRAVVVHVRRCPNCQAELVEVAAGYGALQGVAREGLTDVAEPPPLAVHPLEAVPDRAADPVAGSAGAGRDGPAAGPRRAGPSRVVSIAGAAAAAVLLVVAGVAIGTRIEGDQIAAPTTTTTAPPDASVAFIRKGDIEADGTVAMADIDGTDGAEQLMTVDVSELPPAPDGSFYEVWLLQPDTEQMLAVGVLPNSGVASFALPAAIVANYQAVDVSVQPDDGGVVHSGESILRATYA